MSHSQLATRDLLDGLRRYRLWGALGWLDIRQRYRRSIIGPFWITLSLGILIVGSGVIYGAIFRIELREYFPFLATGLITWGLIAAFVTDGCLAFIGAEAAIKQMPVPLSVHVFRMVWRNVLIMGHNLIIYVLLMLYFAKNPGLAPLLAIGSVLILAVNGFAFGLTLGILSARFRDIPQLAGSVIQLIFFVTPVIWMPESLPGRPIVVFANPFYYLLEIVRGPLLGSIPPLGVWAVVFLFTGLNLAVAFYLYRRFRWRIPYWL